MQLTVGLIVFFLGQNGGRRPIHRPGRWHQAAEAAGDNIIGETGQAEQRTHARP